MAKPATPSKRREAMTSHDLGTLLLGNPRVPLVLFPRAGTPGWFMAVALTDLTADMAVKLDAGPVPATGEDLETLRAQVIAPEEETDELR